MKLGGMSQIERWFVTGVRNKLRSSDGQHRGATADSSRRSDIKEALAFYNGNHVSNERLNRGRARLTALSTIYNTPNADEEKHHRQRAIKNLSGLTHNSSSLALTMAATQ